jgi:hypothetical protein
MDAFPRAKNVVTLVDESLWPQYMAKNTVKDAVWKILDQNGFGACASAATTLAEMTCREISNLDRVVLNMLSLYRQVNGGGDNGSGIDDNLEAIMRTGILPESYWSQDEGWQRQPPSGWQVEAAKYRGIEAFDVRTKAEFGSCICEGYPVVVGVDWGGGGHAICFVRAWSDKAEFANSWGDWGNAGFGEMGWSQITQGIVSFGAWALRVATYS